ncbi:2367_t:CDS:1 [Ambispora leptoticha]|uniref:2367_t:CDS:1 n=1 Tax=Ambispora leptoticha TaxID=144679 RepID=A0A9N9BAI6_9GLOM|nr:2367_t:CDS:1 [Ambispora leptoticha]
MFWFSEHPDCISEDRPAAELTIPNIPNAEGRLGILKFFHYSSQPSRSTESFKRALQNFGDINEFKARYHHKAIVIGSKAYIIGGHSSVGVVGSDITSMLVMDYSTLAVNEQNPKLSVTGHEAVPISDSKFLLLFGTESVTPLKFADPVRQVDIQTGVVSTLNISGTASARYAHTATVVGKKVYVLGGISESNILGDFMYLDLTSYSWNTINSTSPIAGHSTLVVGKYLISCFGFDSSLNLKNDCNVFDTSSNMYVSSKISGTIPAPRSCSSMVSADNNDKMIYVFGGFDKDFNGYNDLYVLDASNAPDLSWSSVSVSAKVDRSLIPSPRGAHIAFVKSGLMTIWGGYSNTTITDGNLYFFDTKVNMWVDSQSLKNANSTSQFNQSNGGPNTLMWSIIVGIACIIGLMLCLLGFFIIRRRKLKKDLQDKCETCNDPYFRPGGQLGSEPDLLSNSEKIHNKSPGSVKSIRKPSLPMPSFIRPRSKYENDSISLERHNSNASVVSTSMSMSSDALKKTDPSPFPITHITEPQRMKRSHRRTSSVTLSVVDVENITHQTHHRPVNNHSNSRYSSQNPSYSLRRSVLSSTLDSYALTDNIFDINRGSSVKSVNSLQWVGFNSSVTDVQNGRKLSLHVRNDYHRKSDEVRDSDSHDEYIIHGDYIDTTNRNSPGQYYPGRNGISGISRQRGISEEEEYKYDSNTSYMIQKRNYASGSDRTSEESGSFDKFSNRSISSQSSTYSSDNFNNNSEDKRKVEKSKRSSKRTSKVSFAPTDEKIEFDELESSKSVYLARISGRSSQSSTSSSMSSNSTPSIAEENEDFEDNTNTLKTDPNILKTYRVFEDEFSSDDYRLSFDEHNSQHKLMPH